MAVNVVVLGADRCWSSRWRSSSVPARRHGAAWTSAPHDLRSPRAWISMQRRASSALMGAAAARGRRRSKVSIPASWYLVAVEPPDRGSTSWCCRQVFNRRIPFLKFFLKQAADLGAGPRAGVVGARLPVHAAPHGGVPAKHPEAAARTSRRRARPARSSALMPTSVMNFVEGTRFTPAKHAAFKSPYRHLLPPRAGRRRRSCCRRWAACCTRCSTSRIAYSAPARPDAVGPVLRPASAPCAWTSGRRPIETWAVGRATTRQIPAFRARFKEWLGGALDREGRKARHDADRAC
ncbi:MAG: hypothetical protein MZV64_44815 [Ignavibacteriales bacterium]|nr:hypothetical protein [Ignavibacteriales bacterium]